MTDFEKEKYSNNFFEKRHTKEKYKLIIITSLLTSIISIVIFCRVSYHLYSYNRYRECLNNNGALWNYEEGKLQLTVTHDDATEKIYSGYGMKIYMNEIDGIHTITDENDGFVKGYKNNILQYIYVDDNLADFISYLNPKVWFGGVRNIKSSIIYKIRSDKDIEILNKLIIEGGEAFLSSSNLEFIKVNDKYIIIK
ncbi:MAG: hypothetical protein N4A50_09630 [Vallitalea sp.]|nr:hypothetical protein [Vallitalea sp.]